MKRLVTHFAPTLALLLGATAYAQQQPTAQDLVGTWKLISEKVKRGDQTTEPLGSDPLGLMMLDRSGNVMMTISRRDLPRIAAKRRDAGTPEENKGILSGLLAYTGTYKVDPEGALTYHIEASTFPNWIGTDQKHFFKLSGKEMTWTNYAPAVNGETAVLVWRRMD
jgi:Lipocalin-like domain